jgi:hypothetical protein
MDEQINNQAKSVKQESKHEDKDESEPSVSSLKSEIEKAKKED